MPDEASLPPVSKKARWIGYALSGLPVVALVASGVMKLAKPPSLVQGFIRFGFAESAIAPLGVVELVITVLYLIPRTSVLGAILITGYFGGATATTFRVGQAWAPTVLLGVLVWGGLFLREPRVRALLPFRRS